ncbi:hypothetical protein L596_005931 [Steinernema carpocapsae]|uniref:Uncharacterized protein n=1 Tax=Steinernema carpocapsae TaxID=34508 RepID=A0A4U8V0P1_STECR|nr:hypothetical protein L596_005931 [Steinernema carpocapsae]
MPSPEMCKECEHKFEIRYYCALVSLVLFAGRLVQSDPLNTANLRCLSLVNMAGKDCLSLLAFTHSLPNRP